MRPAVVSLAAGASQLVLLERVRAAGLAVVAVDRDPEAPGFALADARVVHSTHEAAGLAERLRALPGLELRGVLTRSSGAPVLAAARVARELGLPGLDPDLAARASTKPGLVGLAREAGVPAPPGISTSSADDSRLAALHWPRVVRPACTRVGKLGIRCVEGPAEFERAFAQAASSSADGVVRVEALVPGEDVVVAGTLEAGQARIRTVFDEDTRFGPDGLVRGHGFRWPSRVATGPHGRRVREAALRFLASHRLGTGVFFLTFRIDRRGAPGVCLLEAHLDLPGDHLLETFLPACGGPDFLGQALALATGAPVPQEAPRSTGNTVLRFLHTSDLARAGPGLRQRLARLPGCLRVDLELAPTATEDPRVGLVLLRAGGDSRGLENEVDEILRQSRAAV
jgi:hypothetical protein